MKQRFCFSSPASVILLLATAIARKVGASATLAWWRTGLSSPAAEVEGPSAAASLRGSYTRTFKTLNKQIIRNNIIVAFNNAGLAGVLAAAASPVRHRVAVDSADVFFRHLPTPQERRQQNTLAHPPHPSYLLRCVVQQPLLWHGSLWWWRLLVIYKNRSLSVWIYMCVFVCVCHISHCRCLAHGVVKVVCVLCSQQPYLHQIRNILQTVSHSL